MRRLLLQEVTKCMLTKKVMAVLCLGSKDLGEERTMCFGIIYC
jgi:hypothetical protein